MRSLFVFAMLVATVVAEDLPPEKLPAGWEAIDERTVFLTVRLANTETSLDAVEKAIAADTRKKAPRSTAIKKADQKIDELDRNGGGPMKWTEFYGTTANQFFYRPANRGAGYYTLLALSQQTAPEQVVPLQRPPQFDYIYKANEKTKARAQSEIAELQGKIQVLIERRQRLESEQAGLWCSIACRVIKQFDLDKKPVYRFESTARTRQNADVFRASASFMASALSIIKAADQDQDAAFTKVKEVIAKARQNMTDAWLMAGFEPDKTSNAGKFAALAKRLDDIASNLSESYTVALEGDIADDVQRKETFRCTLQSSLVTYAQLLLAMDEMLTSMKTDWGVAPDPTRPLVFVKVTGLGVTKVDKVTPVSETVVTLEDVKLPSFKNSIGMEFKLIPAGVFMMGSPTYEDGHKASETQHEVTISKPFYIGVYEVTQQHYEYLMGTNPSANKGRNLPVDSVSWENAAEFCKRLTMLERRRIGYRLPTEAEWEYACRAGSGEAYSFVNPNLLSSFAWMSDNAKGHSNPIGTRKPNRWGLHDMHGNLFEWCSDWKADYDIAPAVDPQGPKDGDKKVLRGGSWGNGGVETRCADRGAAAPANKADYFGFRVVLDKR